MLSNLNCPKCGSQEARVADRGFAQSQMALLCAGCDAEIAWESIPAHWKTLEDVPETWRGLAISKDSEEAK